MKLQAVGWIIRDKTGKVCAVRTKHEPQPKDFDRAYPEQAPHVLKELFEKVEGASPVPPPRRRRPTSIMGKILDLKG